jgi:uncharacterized protein (TIGR00369 family)
MTEVHHRRLEAMYLHAPINGIHRPTIKVSDGAATVEMDVQEHHFHSAKSVHGSILFKMLDDASYFAVASLVDDVFVVTVSFTTHMTRPVLGGRLSCTGRVVHAGKNLYLAEAVVANVDGKDVARGSGSFMRSSLALDEALGYVRDSEG